MKGTGFSPYIESFEEMGASPAAEKLGGFFLLAGFTVAFDERSCFGEGEIVAGNGLYKYVCNVLFAYCFLGFPG